MKLIERKHYMNELRQVRGIPDIKVMAIYQFMVDVHKCPEITSRAFKNINHT